MALKFNLCNCAAELNVFYLIEMISRHQTPPCRIENGFNFFFDVMTDDGYLLRPNTGRWKALIYTSIHVSYTCLWHTYDLPATSGNNKYNSSNVEIKTKYLRRSALFDEKKSKVSWFSSICSIVIDNNLSSDISRKGTSMRSTTDPHTCRSLDECASISNMYKYIVGLYTVCGRYTA